jgi:hypothetical protein
MYELHDYLRDNENEYPSETPEDGNSWFKPFPDEVEDLWMEEKASESS